MPAAVTIRPVETAEWPLVGAFLAQGAELAMPVLAQLQTADHESPDHALAAFQKGQLIGLIVLGGNGLVHLCCPDLKVLDNLLNAWANDYEGACLGLVGPREQVDAALLRLGGNDLLCRINNSEQVSLYDLSTPLHELPHGVAVRTAHMGELPMLCGWRTAFFNEIMNMPLTSGLVAMANQELQQLNPQGRLLVLEHNGMAVAMGHIVSEISGTAQLGGFYVSPELRNRGYGTLLLAGMCHTTRQRSNAKAILYTTHRCAGLNKAAQKLGFRAAGEMGTILFAEPVTPPQKKAA